MWIHSLNPVLLDLGPVEIRWYGLTYVFGFLLAAWFVHKYRHTVPLEKEEVWDLILYVILGVLIGSRLFEVFWDPSYYLSNPLNFFKVWNGGMSFHGGFVGILVALWLFARKKQRSFLQLADLLSFPAMFALALGRIANFINGELWGTVTNVSWCVDFSQNPHVPNVPEGCRHPQQLYAAAYRFAIAGWLLFLTTKNKFKPGLIFWNFVLLEGIGRFIVDFWREDILWGPLTIGQWFSMVMVLVALYIIIKNYCKELSKLWHT